MHIQLDLVTSFFNRRGIQYCLAGGFAVASYGVKRFTDDLDFFVMVDTYDLPSLLESMSSELPVTGFDLQYRSLLKVYISGLRVDIISTSTPEEERGLKNASYLTIFGVRCRTIKLEDLLLLKLSIAWSEKRHAIDVELICKQLGSSLNIVYLRQGIKDLNLEAQTGVIESLLGIPLR